uniref:Uncharacterized protein n=1 Tax=Pipistrellus kuhlii TaxID=59472 RepID=A0A7J7XVU1_PIPKU|nr:hypothetical protein mPipKuh1_010426 [Pipistrellus kuhlii]
MCGASLGRAELWVLGTPRDGFELGTFPQAAARVVGGGPAKFPPQRTRCQAARQGPRTAWSTKEEARRWRQSCPLGLNRGPCFPDSNQGGMNTITMETPCFCFIFSSCHSSGKTSQPTWGPGVGCGIISSVLASIQGLFLHFTQDCSVLS